MMLGAATARTVKIHDINYQRLDLCKIARFYRELLYLLLIVMLGRACLNVRKFLAGAGRGATVVMTLTPLIFMWRLC